MNIGKAFSLLGFVLTASLASTIVLRCALCNLKIISKELNKLCKNEDKDK